MRFSYRRPISTSAQFGVDRPGLLSLRSRIGLPVSCFFCVGMSCSQPSQGWDRQLTVFKPASRLPSTPLRRGVPLSFFLPCCRKHQHPIYIRSSIAVLPPRRKASTGTVAAGFHVSARRPLELTDSPGLPPRRRLLRFDSGSGGRLIDSTTTPEVERVRRMDNCGTPNGLLAY